jgi:hypothetical protein
MCKIKNGGMEILVDKVVYEQKVRALEEENNKKDGRIKELEDQLEDVWARFEEVEDNIDKKLEEKLRQIAPPQPRTVNNGALVVGNNNNVNNNHIQIQQINIHINDYDKPSLEGVMMTPDELAQTAGRPMIWSILEQIFFNKNKPENHSVFMSNKKERDLVAYQAGDWRLYSGKSNTDRIALSMLVTANGVAHETANRLGANNVVFDALPTPTQTVIKEWSKKAYGLKPGATIKDIYPLEEVYEQILQHREIVKPTVLASGCKLIKG